MPRKPPPPKRRHTKLKTVETRPSSAKRGYGHAWRTKTRPAAMRAGGGVCAFAGRVMGCRGVAELIDHIKPLNAGGTHSEKNLRPLCRECHAKVTGRFKAEGINEPRDEDFCNVV